MQMKKIINLKLISRLKQLTIYFWAAIPPSIPNLFCPRFSSNKKGFPLRSGCNHITFQNGWYNYY